MRFYKPIIAMEASNDSIRLALVKNKTLDVDTLQAYELDEEVVMENVLADFLRINRLPGGTKILLLIKSPLAMFRFAELPKLPAKELDKVVKLNYRNYLPVDENDYRLDYRVLQNADTGLKAVFAAFPRDILEMYVKIFQDLCLKPVLIDLYQNCIADYFSSLHTSRILTVSRYGDRINVVFVELGYMQGVKDLSFFDEVRLSEDLCKLPGYFVYAPIDTIYFIREAIPPGASRETAAEWEDHERDLWAKAYSSSSFVYIEEKHLALQALVERYYKKHIK